MKNQDSNTKMLEENQSPILIDNNETEPNTKAHIKETTKFVNENENALEDNDYANKQMEEKKQKIEILLSDKQVSENQNKASGNLLDNLDLNNSFERLEKTKLDEIDDLFSPFDIKCSHNKNLANNSQEAFNINLNTSSQANNPYTGKVSVFKLQDNRCLNSNINNINNNQSTLNNVKIIYYFNFLFR